MEKVNTPINVDSLIDIDSPIDVDNIDKSLDVNDVKNKNLILISKENKLLDAFKSSLDNLDKTFKELAKDLDLFDINDDSFNKLTNHFELQHKKFLDDINRRKSKFLDRFKQNRSNFNRGNWKKIKKLPLSKKHFINKYFKDFDIKLAKRPWNSVDYGNQGYDLNNPKLLEIDNLYDYYLNNDLDKIKSINLSIFNDLNTLFN